jgi:hypothetical protein
MDGADLPRDAAPSRPALKPLGPSQTEPCSTAKPRPKAQLRWLGEPAPTACDPTRPR